MCIDQLLKESPFGNHDLVDINLSDDKDLKRLGILKHIYNYSLSISISSKLILSCCMMASRPWFDHSVLFCFLSFKYFGFNYSSYLQVTANWSWIITLKKIIFHVFLYLSQLKMDWTPKTLVRTIEHIYLCKCCLSNECHPFSFSTYN